MNNLQIQQGENGFICSWEEEQGDGKLQILREVIEETGEVNVIERLLYFAAEHFGVQYDKYGKENLNITWNKKGHKL